MRLSDFEGTLFFLLAVALAAFIGLIFAGYVVLPGERGGGAVEDFTLLASPPTRRVEQARNAVYSVAVRAPAGFGDDVRLAISGATGFISPPRVRPPGTAKLTVTTSLRTVPGTYPITIIGRSRSVVRRARISLVVGPASSPP